MNKSTYANLNAARLNEREFSALEEALRSGNTDDQAALDEAAARQGVAVNEDDAK